jgi:hypothetical protein
VETALSRFPIHRLAKKGSISIDLQRLTENGKADFKWEVTYNIKHGQPGPLAYKVDTLIINRCIDEMGRPLPEVIRIGSLSDICRALGSSDTGPNIADLKRAFLQNASAFINAKIRYKTKAGKDKWGEIGYSRYSVIFTGEALPDGRQADAVYMVLNPPYRDLLNHVELRPLDYDYLVQLPPGAQRFYELLSFQIYGAIAGARPRAKMLYSDYCKYAPQTRYLDFDHVKKQMYKVHLPHRESGYIVKVDYDDATDIEGNPDWEMFYTPGPKAIAEYHAFTNRQNRQFKNANLGLKPSIPEPARQPVQAKLDLSETENNLLDELRRRGVTPKKAHMLLANLKPGQEFLDQLEYVDHLIANAPPGKFHNPAGFYVKFIEDNAPVPDFFWSSRKKRLFEDTEQLENAQNARQVQLEIEYEEYQTAEVRRYLTEIMPPHEYQKTFEEVREANGRLFKQMTSAELDGFTHDTVCAEVKQSGRVPLLSFGEFCRKAGYY